MKKLWMVLFFLPLIAFGADVAPTPETLIPPEVISNILLAIQGLPYVGPVVFQILKWIAIIAPIMTALSVCAQVILMLPEVVARFAGAHALADKIKFWSDKIGYVLKFLSIRNAK